MLRYLDVEQQIVKQPGKLAETSQPFLRKKNTIRNQQEKGNSCELAFLCKSLNVLATDREHQFAVFPTELRKTFESL